MAISKQSKVVVFGAAGMVGSAIVRELKFQKYENVLAVTRKELDLLDKQAVDSFLNTQKPERIFLAAARVGGIHANNSYRADFIYQNLQIQNNVIWGAHQANVPSVVFLGSSCIYPRNAPQPMKEEALLTSSLEMTNRPYAVAKIAGLELVDSLRRQYARNYFSVMPTNMYGSGDNFHPENSHVFASLIRKFCEAVKQNASEVSVWGSGKPFREFMHSEDCASAIVFLAEKLTFEDLQKSSIAASGWSHINVGSEEEITIGDLAKAIALESGFKGKIVFDASKPDGTPRKLMDSSFLKSLGWKPRITLKEGIPLMINYFRSL